MHALIQALLSDPGVDLSRATWEGRAGDVISEALAIQAIPAPTFEEGPRGQHIAQRFDQLGLADISIDSAGNVTGRTPGLSAKPALLITAHLDTVFSQDTDLTTRHDDANQRIYGPGLGDNSTGLAGMLQLAAYFQQLDAPPQHDIYWVGTSGEEGLGNLMGIREVIGRMGGWHEGGTLGAALVLEGIGLGRVYHAGLGVRRLKITVSGPGGHSWLHRHKPSAIHHLVTVGAALVDGVHPPDAPAASFNIGLVDGGTSINTRAPEASLSIDLRSEDQAALSALERGVRAITAGVEHAPELDVEISVIGDRPSAALDPHHSLVKASQAVLHHLGFKKTTPEIGSTDANIPLAARIPSVCVGITSGGGAHTIKEFIDTPPVSTGMRQLAMLAHLADRSLEGWSVWAGS